MRDKNSSFISRSFLRSVWAQDFEAFRDSDEERQLEQVLRNWDARRVAGEAVDDAGLTGNIFETLWGYRKSGDDEAQEYTLTRQFPVPHSGPQGRQGSADGALGYFNADGIPDVMQVACEFKGLDANLDAPQRGRRDLRSPVEQCLNYLTCARRGMTGNETIMPSWGIVTDMNEFRLYWYDRAPTQFLRFNISQRTLLQGPGLLGDDEGSRFERYLFKRIFHADTLLTRGGKSALEQLIARAWIRARELENAFYKEYRAYREHLYLALLEANPNFPGTKGRLVRMAQKILDRSIFIFYCEDMGRALGYPPQLLRDFLIDRSRDPYFDGEGNSIWQDVCRLYRAMNDGTAFGDHQLNQFNGGLFAADEELEGLRVPNRLFCVRGQGHDEASLYQNALTLLYLSAAYNYAADLAQGVAAQPEHNAEPGTAEAAADARKADPNTALGLYTLGRIFEQSITELEILEAEADGRVSVNKESKRKRDGVYYTPEWVVERIVRETVGKRLTDIKGECGWAIDVTGHAETQDVAAIDAYRLRLQDIRIIDPACGSGAFLITTLKYLLGEWGNIQELRRRVTGDNQTRDEDAVIRDVLRNNLYGVDINPASVEITQLALWLHTARGDRPLSSLDAHIKDGNSLIDGRFWLGQIDLDLDDAEERDRINTFDWRERFPDAFPADGPQGFDVVLGNPPYVKLQNFRKAHPDMASFLRNGRDGTDFRGYASAKSGSFDLYLPFIEKGLDILKPGGRLGYIAPSVWIMNKYGSGLRTLVANQRSLDRWLDFRSHQIFDEATVYTALQFFHKPADCEAPPPENLYVAAAPDGLMADDPWGGNDSALGWEDIDFGDRWLMLSGHERTFVDRLDRDCLRLEDERFTEAIYQGLITSADPVYHLKKIAPGRFISVASGNIEVAIEDAIMHPLVSGDEAKRYIEPETDTFILFPYLAVDGRMTLIPAAQMELNFPNAWAYLGSHEADLRARESRTFDNDEWYQFGRTQNLGKQEMVKLVVAGTVPGMRVSLDTTGDKYLNNVRVNGILPAEGIDSNFLLSVLNGPVADFVFRRIAKPKDNKFFEANKQFIAPIPIPIISTDDQQVLAANGRELQRLHSLRRDRMGSLRARFDNSPLRLRPLHFVFPLLAEAENRQEEEVLAYATIDECLHPDVILDAQFIDGELRLLADGAAIIRGVFLSPEEGPFIAAQWNGKIDSFKVGGRNSAKSLVTDLRRLIVTDNAVLISQVVALQDEIRGIATTIAALETETNELLYDHYQLTPQERAMVEAG